jgi:hypothetical protein
MSWIPTSSFKVQRSTLDVQRSDWDGCFFMPDFNIPRILFGFDGGWGYDVISHFTIAGHPGLSRFLHSDNRQRG